MSALNEILERADDELDESLLRGAAGPNATASTTRNNSGHDNGNGGSGTGSSSSSSSSSSGGGRCVECIEAVAVGFCQQCEGERRRRQASGVRRQRTFF